LDSPDVDGVVTALLNQTGCRQAWEIIVSDCRLARWRKPIEELAARHPNVTYLCIDRDPLERARALNAALAKATGNHIVFLAGDFTPEPNFLAVHEEFHEKHPDPKSVAIGQSRFIPAQASSQFVAWLERDGRIFGIKSTVGDADGFFYFGNSSIKRSFLEKILPLDEDFHYDAWDDFETGERLRALGLVSTHLPEALTWHAHAEAPTYTERAQAMFHAGKSAAVFERKHPGPYTWTGTCDAGTFRLERHAVRRGLLYLLSRDNEHLDKFYEARLDACFVRGWRQERSTRA